MISSTDEAELAHLFLESAIGEIPWARPLETVAGLFDSEATFFTIHKPDTMKVVDAKSHSYSDEFLSSFFSGEIYSNDPRIDPIGKVRAGTVYFDELLYDVDEIHRDKWVRASTESLQVCAQVGARLRLPDGGEALLCVLRKARETDLLATRAEAMRRVAPRIEQAISIGYVIERERATRTALLEFLASKLEGFVLLDLFGRSLFVNDSAERMFAESDGLSLASGEIRAARRCEDSALKRLIEGCLRQQGGGRLLVSRLSRRRPFLVAVMPAPERECFLTKGTIACVVRIQDLASPPAPTAEALRAVFGLTGRESELAAQLVRSTRLAAAAAQCGMTVNTARNHLQAIFVKTGATGQADLVQMLGRIS